MTCQCSLPPSQLHNPLVPARMLLSASHTQWVLGLHFDPQSSRLVAASQDAVYVIDTQVWSGNMWSGSMWYSLEHFSSVAPSSEEFIDA